MKRGFLNTRKGQSAISVTSMQAPSKTLQPVGNDTKTDETKKPIKIMKFPKITDTSLPEGYIPQKLNQAEGDTLGISSTGENAEDIPLILSRQPFVTPKASLADFPDGWSECIVVPKVLDIILTTPNFPRPLPHLKAPRHRLDFIPGKGLGMFATVDCKADDTIVWERPLMVCPADCGSTKKVHVPAGSNDLHVQLAIFERFERLMEAAVNQMDPTNQEAFRALANSHQRDGSPPLMGILRTNGLTLGKLKDPDLPGAAAMYSGVCKIASRVNHSCVPNALWSFDIPTFAIRLYAFRPIKAGQEVTISYGPWFEDPLEMRRRVLEPYGFQCTCISCLQEERKAAKNGGY